MRKLDPQFVVPARPHSHAPSAVSHSTQYNSLLIVVLVYFYFYFSHTPRLPALVVVLLLFLALGALGSIRGINL